MENKAVILILSDARGVYIPRDFVTDAFNKIDKDHCERWGIIEEDAETLQNPENPLYWETWDCVLSSAKFTAENGDVYNLHHDGDLWGLCYDKMTEEEKDNFGFEFED